MYACCTYASMNTEASMLRDMQSHNAWITVVSAEGLDCNLSANRPPTSSAEPLFIHEQALQQCKNVEPLVLLVSSSRALNPI